MSVLDLTHTALARRGEELLAEATALHVVNMDSFKIVAAIRAAAKTYEKQIHADFDPEVETHYKDWKAAVERRAKLLERSQRVLAIVDHALGRYEQEQRRLKAAAEDAARKQAEALRLEAEAKQRAQMEQLRKEAEERQLQAALEAEALGDSKLADILVETEPVVVAPEPVAVFVPPPVVEMPKAEGLSFRDEWGEFEVTDEALIPREYWVLDEVKIRRIVKAKKVEHPIPGIKAAPRRIPVQRLAPA